MTDVNGNNPREIYHTVGAPGFHEIPPSPVNPEKPALDVEITALDWSPDDSALALSICATQRYANSHTNDPICYLEVRALTTGELIYKPERLNRLNWGSNNRIIAEGGDAYGNTRAFCVWQVDINVRLIAETLLVPGSSLVSLRDDRFPVWSPDGNRFVTSRRIAGYSYYADGSRNYHRAITLFEAGSSAGCTLMVADQGDTPANFSWSPDGKYLLYSLNQGDASDVWWLDVASGATGKVTNDGNSIAAQWRPACAGTACNPNPNPNPKPNPSFKSFLPLVRR